MGLSTDGGRIGGYTMTVEHGSIMASAEMPDLGALTDVASLWEGVEMKCPKCGENTPDSWSAFWPESAMHGERASRAAVTHAQPFLDVGDAISCNIEYMQCANAECRQMVIRLNEIRTTTRFRGGVPIVDHSGSKWIVYPRHSERSVDLLVPEPFRRNYLEAAAILDISARASAMLARRVLADLLETYGGRAEYGLATRIDKFNEDTTHPHDLRKNLHYIREIGDFSAHTKKDDQANIIDVDREEAEWTLNIVDRLFDYFIVTPTRDAQMRQAMDEKLKAANRRPVRPLPDEKADKGDQE